MNRRALSGTALFSLLAFVSPSWAQLKWIPEKDRGKVKLSGEFKTPDGGEVSLKDLKAKVVFLNFWATWCGPCKEEMPGLAELSNKFSSQGLIVIAATNEDPKIVRDFLRDKEFPFPIILDSRETLLDRFKVTVVPTTVVIDGKGRVAFRVGGAFNWNSPETIAAFEELLSEPR